MSERRRLKSSGSRLFQSEPAGGGCLITLSWPLHTVTAAAAAAARQGGVDRPSAEIVTRAAGTSDERRLTETKGEGAKDQQNLRHSPQQIVSDNPLGLLSILS
ncbi:hypothetical protein CRENBAI_013343 [Crenichthys baileyi]|uniref:Uncharacterized protein n=1 Tax=Crenichthys baileyi TaxID=28760 RepID=A0AAV9RFD7_9TELE